MAGFPSVSHEARQHLLEHKLKRATIVSPLPVLPPHSPFEQELLTHRAKLASLNNDQAKQYVRAIGVFIPQTLTDNNVSSFEITCKSCQEVLAYVYADDATLLNWHATYYVSSYDATRWYGCMAVNVSPIDSALGFECACGVDTRDFRANRNTLLKQRTQDNLEQRTFGKSKSAFKAIHKSEDSWLRQNILA